MKYYCASDIHGFYDEFILALEEKGYFSDGRPRKLIVLGDLFDRGRGAEKLESFIMNLIEKDEVILIRGNHEDLMLDMIEDWDDKSYLMSHHNSNGTVRTALDLTGTTYDELFLNPSVVAERLRESAYIKTIIPETVDYYETENYIFVHGWIPCTVVETGFYHKEYIYSPGWRTADKKAWDGARWINGMEAAHSGVVEKGKTIVSGHWHTSFGHSRYEKRGGEFSDNPDFSPYYGDGIIALDGCTAFSHKVNVVVLED